MKKLLLVALMAGGLSFAAAPRSDAQVFFSIGVGPGYYGGYYPYRSYYRPYYGYSYYRPYWYGGHRYYRHYRHHRYHHRY